MISEITSVKTRLVDKIYRVTTESGKSVDVSETHGFYITREEEIYAHELVEGESKIFVKDGDNIKLELVTSLEIIFGEHQVYTFSVPGLFNYISNNIVSHNTATGPQQATTSLAYGFSKSTTLTMTSGTKYYRFRRYYYARAQYVNDGDNSDRTYSIKTDMDSYFQLTPLTQGTEINNAGLQVNKSNTKVFRVDMSSVTDSAQRPIIDVVGGMRIDYFQPYNSTADGGLTDKTYNQYNSNINYNERAYPLTRFVAAVDLYNGVSNLNSGGASGHANIGVASLTRSSEGYGYLVLEQYHAKNDGACRWI